MTQNFNPDTEKPSENSTATGLIERIVENWLTSASERTFQIPFCQLLSAKGEKLLYIATHGQFEKGKDVITELPDGTLRAYQMKGGDIKLAQWREIAVASIRLIGDDLLQCFSWIHRKLLQFDLNHGYPVKEQNNVVAVKAVGRVHA